MPHMSAVFCLGLADHGATGQEGDGRTGYPDGLQRVHAEWKWPALPGLPDISGRQGGLWKSRRSTVRSSRRRSRRLSTRMRQEPGEAIRCARMTVNKSGSAVPGRRRADLGGCLGTAKQGRRRAKLSASRAGHHASIATMPGKQATALSQACDGGRLRTDDLSTPSRLEPDSHFVPVYAPASLQRGLA